MPRLSAEKQKDAMRRTQGRTIWNALRLRSGHFQRKMILNFGISERLRAFRYSIFTAGVVTGNGIAVPLPAEARHCGKVIFSVGQKANADYLYGPPREKAIRENPQIFPNRKL